LKLKFGVLILSGWSLGSPWWRIRSWRKKLFVRSSRQFRFCYGLWI